MAQDSQGHGAGQGFCTSCGAAVASEAGFCVQCGTPVVQQVQRPAEPGPPPAYAHVSNYLVQAILVTIFCCVPFGIVAIVYAAQVNGKLAAGDYEGAAEKSAKAKTWCWVSFGIVAVAAIMGIMAAVAVPMVTSQIGKTREKSYAQDLAMIQTAVDSFFTAADNTRHLGQRQYPILGANSSVTGTATVLWADAGTDVSVATVANPVRGNRGGEPKWRDDGDGNRESSEDNLNGATDTAADSDTGWFVDKVTFQGKDFAVDSRDYFIDFDKLVAAGLLQSAPESASTDNGGGSAEGSYGWYVKASGQVDSVYYYLPSNGIGFDGTRDGTLDLRGFFEGVYP